MVEGQTVAGWEVRSIKPTEILVGRGKTDTSNQVIKINEKRDKSAVVNQVVKPAPQSPAEKAPQSPAEKAPPPETPAEEQPPAE